MARLAQGDAGTERSFLGPESPWPKSWCLMAVLCLCPQFWHKACFHCETCKMTLNMKNYKGYEKTPYCNA